MCVSLFIAKLRLKKEFDQEFVPAVECRQVRVFLRPEKLFFFDDEFAGLLVLGDLFVDFLFFLLLGFLFAHEQSGDAVGVAGEDVGGDVDDSLHFFVGAFVDGDFDADVDHVIEKLLVPVEVGGKQLQV